MRFFRQYLLITVWHFVTYQRHNCILRYLYIESYAFSVNGPSIDVSFTTETDLQLEPSLAFARFPIGIITHIWVLLTQTQLKQDKQREPIVGMETTCGKRLWKLESVHTTAIYGDTI